MPQRNELSLIPQFKETKQKTKNHIYNGKLLQITTHDNV